MPSGRCHCGAIAYRFEGEVRHSSICHCEDCRRCAGAVGVAWIGVEAACFTVEQGEPAGYRSTSGTMRYFCGGCGTGLYYVNETVSPGLVDIQTATLDDPTAFPPLVHVQLADALAWEASLPELPGFARFPPPEA